MTPPRLTSFRTPTPRASDDSPTQHGQFRYWQPVPPGTPLRDLHGTSLLVIAQHSLAGRLVRCSPALDEGSATLVHADVRRPNALRMLEMDDDFPIGEQARVLLSTPAVHVLAIPHITWKHLDGRVRWRTPVTVLVALLTALAVILIAPPLSVAAALPVSAGAGLLVWLVLRRRVPTTIAPFNGQHHSAADVLHHALHHMGLPGASTSGPIRPLS